MNDLFQSKVKYDTQVKYIGWLFSAGESQNVFCKIQYVQNYCTHFDISKMPRRFPR